jgi:RNA polymerase-binding transcription factor DksA
MAIKKTIIPVKAAQKKAAPAKKTVAVKKTVQPVKVAQKKVAPKQKVAIKKIAQPVKAVQKKAALVKKKVEVKKAVTKVKTVQKKSVPAKKIAKTVKQVVKTSVPAKKVEKKAVKVEKDFAKKPVSSKKIKEEKKIVKNEKSVAKKPVPVIKVTDQKKTEKAVTSISKTSDPGEKIRYSDAELMEFKEIIINKLEAARRDLALLTEAYTTKNENDTNDTSPTFKVLEEGSNVLSKEENSQLASRQQKFIRDLENAMLRIENKTYGICRVTGKLIPKERLKVVPHATMSIEAKLSSQKQAK